MRNDRPAQRHRRSRALAVSTQDRCGPGRVPAPGRPLVGVRERPGPLVKQGEDLGAGDLHRLVLGVGDDAQAPDVGVLVFVLPRKGAQVGVDDEVDGQVEGVEPVIGAAG
ncbi:hypothetical protein QMK19_35745 [Streptomyces sp. H10-C2]|uniref:hypothetical protein n=1 Tax=unclassified Streptomyces TaxID=2593676 RepID=UPI0024B93E3B|nr:MULTISPECIES: hypothetical protein [unclassified Streptomyces]MDJ0346445.1 hypothetical protein [Streptomyces sp. PH10-H1]MDJ0374831.1 hypothetical protein [Streptomyces sp. H10-C2]